MTGNKPVIESRFEYRGYPCVVIFQPLGHRCGYVGLPEKNRFYGLDYNEIDVDCHGGLTYSSNHLYDQDDTNTWWIGFDCAHSGDSPDLEAVTEAFGDNTHVFMPRDIYGQLWTMKEVEDECCQIIRQIEEFLKQN